jgi:hypothetical protein
LEEGTHPYITEYGMDEGDATALVEFEHLTRVGAGKVDVQIAHEAKKFTDAVIEAHLRGEKMKAWAKSQMNGEFMYTPKRTIIDEDIKKQAKELHITLNAPFEPLPEDFAEKFYKIHSQLNRYGF